MALRLFHLVDQLLSHFLCSHQWQKHCDASTGRLWVSCGKCGAASVGIVVTPRLTGDGGTR